VVWRRSTIRQPNGLGEELPGLFVGVVLERLVAGFLQVVNRLRLDPRRAPVVGEQGEVRRKIARMGTLVRLRDLEVQFLFLPEQKQVVRNVLNDRVLEFIRELRRPRLYRHKTETVKRVEIVLQSRRVRFRRIHVTEDADRKYAPDHPRQLHEQLLGRCQVIDPASDHSLNRVGKFERTHAGSRRHLASSIRNLNYLAVAERRGELLSKKRISL